jgi:hypothetical protein
MYFLDVAPGLGLIMVDSTELGGTRLPIGARLAIDLEGVCFYPTNT